MTFIKSIVIHLAIIMVMTGCVSVSVSKSGTIKYTTRTPESRTYLLPEKAGLKDFSGITTEHFTLESKTRSIYEKKSTHARIDSLDFNSIGSLAKASHVRPMKAITLAKLDLPKNTKKNRRVSEVIDTNNKGSIRYPNDESFHNAVVTYTYEKNVVYSVFTSPGHISDLRFQKGESLVSIAAGDTKNWLIEHALAGDRPHLLIKPMHSGLSTNLTVLTDKRTYWFYLKSWKTTFMPGLEFHYPQEELMQTKIAEAQSMTEKFQIQDMEFDYSIESVCSDNACLKPKTVFANKKQGKLYLIMPEGIQHVSLPALFALDSEGNATMLNYRFVDGIQFVLDSLHDVLMLEYGGKDRRIYIYKSGIKPRSKNAISSFLKWVSEKVDNGIPNSSGNGFNHSDTEMGR